VFYDSLLDAAAGHPAEAAAILGWVMTHELGHLLLPPGPHAPFGLMRGDIDLAERGPGQFSETEAHQLRDAVLRRPIHRPRSGTR
jgi:hypothetical protein